MSKAKDLSELGGVIVTDSNGNLQHLSKPAYFARAWVNFNGTGAVAIRDSGNVSSITDLGTGSYRVNFTTAMPDANYSAQVTVENSVFSDYGSVTYGGGAATGSLSVNSFQANGSVADTSSVYVAVFR